MSTFEKLPVTSIAKVRFRGKEGLPVWAITYFLESTCLNHMKLMSIQRICELASEGAESWRFSVVAYSADIFPNESFSRTYYTDFVSAEKEDDAKKFWYIIEKYKRPIVFYNDGYQKTPLYDFTYEDSARVWSFQEQSPPEGVLIGAASALIELIYAHKRDEREHLAFLNQQINQGTKNLRDIVLTSDVIHNSTAPEGIKRYAEEKINVLLAKQEEINSKLGLCNTNIDIKM